MRGLIKDLGSQATELLLVHSSKEPSGKSNNLGCCRLRGWNQQNTENYKANSNECMSERRSEGACWWTFSWSSKVIPRYLYSISNPWLVGGDSYSILVTTISLVLVRFSSSLEVSRTDLGYSFLRTLRINWISRVVFWGNLSARMWSCKVLMFNDPPLVVHRAEGTAFPPILDPQTLNLN